VLCPNCGSELSDDAPFCLTCSTFVETEASPAPRIASTDDPIADLLQQDRVPEALTLCRQALQSSPEDGDLYAHLGACYRALGQGRAALEAFKQALRYHPTNPAAVQRQLDAVIDAMRAPGPTTTIPATASVELRGGARFTPAPPPEPTPAQRRLRMGLFLVFVVIALLLIGMSIYTALRLRGASPPQPRHVVPLPLGHEPSGGGAPL